MSYKKRTLSVVLDTSFILALVNPQDLGHDKAKEWILGLPSEVLRVEIPLICVIEALIKNPHPGEMVELLRELADNKNFEITTESDLVFIENLPLKYRTKLQANDCIILAAANRLHADLLTLDKDLLDVLNKLRASTIKK